MPLSTLCDIMGHVKIETTRIYAKNSQGKIKYEYDMYVASWYCMNCYAWGFDGFSLKCSEFGCWKSQSYMGQRNINSPYFNFPILILLFRLFFE